MKLYRGVPLWSGSVSWLGGVSLTCSAWRWDKGTLLLWSCCSYVWSLPASCPTRTATTHTPKEHARVTGYCCIEKYNSTDYSTGNGHKFADPAQLCTTECNLTACHTFRITWIMPRTNYSEEKLIHLKWVNQSICWYFWRHSTLNCLVSAWCFIKTLALLCGSVLKLI